MRNNRVRSNDSASPAGGQGDTVTVAFQYPDGREYARVDFPKNVYAAIIAGAKKLGISLDQFFELAVLRKLVKEGRVPPAAPTGKKVHKNFFQINMRQDEQKELRALCAGFGMELRVFLTNAVRYARRELEQYQTIADETKLDPYFVWRLTDAWHSKN